MCQNPDSTDSLCCSSALLMAGSKVAFDLFALFVPVFGGFYRRSLTNPLVAPFHASRWLAVGCSFVALAA